MTRTYRGLLLQSNRKTGTICLKFFSERMMFTTNSGYRSDFGAIKARDM